MRPVLRSFLLIFWFIACAVNAFAQTAPTVSITNPANGATFTAPANVSLAATANPSAPGNMTSQVKVTYTGPVYNRGTQIFNQSVTITNTSSTAIAGPLELVLTSLTSGVTLANKSGSDGNDNPYFTVQTSSLAAEAAVTVNLQFSDPSNAIIGYTPLVDSGAIGATVSLVEFFANGTKVGQASASPFTYAWSSVPASNYALTAKVTDSTGSSATSSAVSITVAAAPALTTVTVSPPTAAAHENGTQALAATGYDQYGSALATQPAFSWSVTAPASGGGGVSPASGGSTTYTAPGSGTSSPLSVTVQAASGDVSGAAQVTVTNAAPTIAAAASASPNPVTGTTAALSVLGADDGGEANLTYTWSVTARPAGAAAPTFSASGTNAAKNCTATFSQAGSYTLLVTVTDAGGLTATSGVPVTVSQTVTQITVSPASPTVPPGGAQQFSASGTDQFGAALATPPTFAWSVTTSGGGSVTSGGLYTAPQAAGSYTVQAASGAVTGSASVTVTQAPPAAPTNLSATAGNGQVTLDWTAPAGPVTSYNIYRSTTSGDPYTTISTAGAVTGTSYTDSTAADGTTYYYVVSAVNAGGESANSGAASAMPVDTSVAPPAAPLSLTATPGDGKVLLSWTAPAGAVACYTVEYGTQSGLYTASIPNLSGTATLVPGLADGTPYFFAVQAVDTGGPGTASGEASATPSAGGTQWIVTDLSGKPIPLNAYDTFNDYSLTGIMSGIATTTYPQDMISACINPVDYGYGEAFSPFPWLAADGSFPAVYPLHAYPGLHDPSIPFPTSEIGEECIANGGVTLGDYSWANAFWNGTTSEPLRGTVTTQLTGNLWAVWWWLGAGAGPDHIDLLLDTNVDAWVRFLDFADQAGPAAVATSEMAATARVSDSLGESASVNSTITTPDISSANQVEFDQPAGGLHLLRVPLSGGAATVSLGAQAAMIASNSGVDPQLGSTPPFLNAAADGSVSATAKQDNREVTISSTFSSPQNPTYHTDPVTLAQVANVRQPDGSLTDDITTPGPSGIAWDYSPNYSGSWGPNSTYVWQASLAPSGGIAMSAAGIFNSTAPFGNKTVPNFTGTYYNPPAQDGAIDTITLTLTDGVDGATASNTYTVRFHDPYPVNFGQMGVKDLGGGVLQFSYGWGSSTGNVLDLKNVIMGETVTYDGNPGIYDRELERYYPPSPPWPANYHDNPTIVAPPGIATIGSWQDQQRPLPGTFVLPTTPGDFSYTGSQVYWWRFANQTTLHLFPGPYTIIRRVWSEPGPVGPDGQTTLKWQYSVTKNGSTATTDVN